MGHAGQSVDTRKIGEAVSHPGIDPRSFVSLAIVTKVSVEAAGVICDVTLMPSKLTESAVYTPIYGGSGYGLYAPIEIDQMVVVLAPEGDPNEGLRIIGRAWDQGEPPPQAVIDNPTDFMLVVQKDSTCRITTAGAGALIIQTEQTVSIMKPNGTPKPLAFKSDVEAVDRKYEGHIHLAAGEPTSGPGSDPIPNPGTPPPDFIGVTPLAGAEIVGTSVLLSE